MEIILTEDVQSLGKRGNVVRVADGYARNYLIPKGWAVLATESNLKMVQERQIALAKKEAKLKEEADILVGELNLLHLVLSRKAGDTGVLFGSVTSKDLSELLAENGVNLDRRKVSLEHPLKRIGNYSIEARPHSEVAVQLEVSVIPEEGDPVSKILKKGSESEQIKAEVDERLRLMEEALASDQESSPDESAADSEPAAD